jgi:hypothetical protein
MDTNIIDFGSLRASINKVMKGDMKLARSAIIVRPMHLSTSVWDLCAIGFRDHSKITHRRSHILIVPSSLPVTNHFPSLWNDTEVTLLVCASRHVN